MQRFFVRRWFLLALAVVLAAGFAFPQRLDATTQAMPRETIVAVVLFLMALPLEIGAMGRALSRPAPTLLAVLLSFGLLPPLAWLTARLLPADLGTGLIIVASVPCTLASAAVWTRRARGNDAVAIMVTMLTNLSCFLVTPAWLQLLTGSRVQLEMSPLVGRLVVLVVIPIVAAQLLRRYRPLGIWATRHRVPLGVLAQCGILSMIFIGTVQSGMRLAAGGEASLVTGSVWLLMIVCVLGLHTVVCLAGYAVARWIGFGYGDRVAVAFSGSQKTLMVGLDIGLQYYGGLTILPMVVYHVGQLLIDTLFADRWQREAPAASGEATPAAH